MAEPAANQSARGTATADAGRWGAAGALLAGLAVALGAFAAHGLKQRLSAEMLAIFETGVRYHFYHALALLALAAHAAAGTPGARLGNSRAVRVAGWAFVFGILIFSGSLYLLAVTGTRWLGAVTPIGGVAFLIGWGALAAGLWRNPRRARESRHE